MSMHNPNSLLEKAAAYTAAVDPAIDVVLLGDVTSMTKCSTYDAVIALRIDSGKLRQAVREGDIEWARAIVESHRDASQADEMVRAYFPGHEAGKL
jgi:hypothetical protein